MFIGYIFDYLQLFNFVCIQSIVWKRYSDFKNLHRSLFVTHRDLYLPGKFPAFIKPKVFGKFLHMSVQSSSSMHDVLLSSSTHKLCQNVTF